MKFLEFYKKSDVNPATGTLLIAEPFLKDPGFARTVILLCEHGDYGTLGFIINKPSNNTVDMLLPKLDFPGVNVYEGGPVQTNSLQIIHQIPQHLGGVEILPNVYWGATYENLLHLYQSGIEVDASNIRLYRGYSGWDVGQLEEELGQNSWITAHGRSELIFETDSKKTWSESLKSLGEEFEYLATLPLDPTLN